MSESQNAGRQQNPNLKKITLESEKLGFSSNSNIYSASNQPISNQAKNQVTPNVGINEAKRELSGMNKPPSPPPQPGKRDLNKFEINPDLDSRKP